MSKSSQIGIPKSSQTKGLYVFCRDCKAKSKTDLPKVPICTHPTDRLVFKAFVYIPGTRNLRTRILKATNHNDAIIEKIEFEKELKANNYVNSPKTTPKKQSLLLLPCIAEYLQYLDNTNVFEHQKKNRSDEHKKQIRRYLERFIDSLITEKISLRNLRLNQIDNNHVSLFHKYLVQSEFANRTYNRHMDTVSEFFNYFINNKGIQFENYFSSTNVQRKRIVSQNDTISIKDFKRLLLIISEENGVQVLSTGEKKYHYHSWLKDAFELALLSGGRRDEIMLMKFSDIIEQDGKLICIRTEDFKYNLKNDLVDDSEKKFIYSPIIYELGLVLQKLGYEKYKNTDRYIIAGDSKRKRETLKENMSNAFTHFYKLLGNGKQLQFRSLRKTYVTLVNNFTNGQGEIITGHSGQGIIMKSYHDRKVFNHVLDNFKMIG